MLITQTKEILATIETEMLGEENTIVTENLANLQDIGNVLITQQNVDTYVKKLVDKIGKVVFKNRLLNSTAPSLLVDSWEYGAILQKVRMKLIPAEENDAVKLVDGHSYDQNVFHQPTVSATFYSKEITFEVPISYTMEQLKSSFNSESELNGFYNLLETTVQNSLTVKTDALIMRTINYRIGKTYTKGRASQKINLLAGYNAASGKSLTTADCFQDEGFLKYAISEIKNYQDRLKLPTSLFNDQKEETFTPVQNQKLVLLSDFKNTVDTHLIPVVQNSENLKLTCETVPYWQGSGANFSFTDISKIDVTLDTTSEKAQVGGIVGILFDDEALKVGNLSQYVTTNYNAKGDFYTNYYKEQSGFFVDLAENFIIFYVG